VDQGLDIVLRNNGLNQEIDGNVLRIATQDTLKREADQRRDLLKAQADAVETVTATRVLSYAKADSMVVTLKRFLTARGDVYADVRSNTLIVRDIPHRYRRSTICCVNSTGNRSRLKLTPESSRHPVPFAREIGTLFAYSTSTAATCLAEIRLLG